MIIQSDFTKNPMTQWFRHWNQLIRCNKSIQIISHHSKLSVIRNCENRQLWSAKWSCQINNKWVNNESLLWCLEKTGTLFRPGPRSIYNGDPNGPRIGSISGSKLSWSTYFCNVESNNSSNRAAIVSRSHSTIPFFSWSVPDLTLTIYLIQLP